METASNTRVFVTGANGFVGSGLCRAFLSHGFHVGALSRLNANTELVPVDCEFLRGDYSHPADMRAILSDFRPHILVHAAAVVSRGRPDPVVSFRVNVEGTRSLAAEALRAKVSRWIQISSMSAHPLNPSIYGSTKLQAEQVVRDAGIPWTILRPSLVYGPARRGIFHQMTRLVSRLPVVPMVGNGSEPMRPVHVEDLGNAAVQAALREEAIGRVYDLGGPEDWTFRDVIRAMRRLLGKPPLLLTMPLPLCRLAAAAAECMLPSPPVTTDNIAGIQLARRPDITAAQRDLAFHPRSFEEGFSKCLEVGRA